jgi:hypothetical protein
MKIDWDIRSEGRSWREGEAIERYFLRPEKLEMVNGKLLWSDEDRETLLGRCWKMWGRPRRLPGRSGSLAAAVRKLDIVPHAA